MEEIEIKHMINTREIVLEILLELRKTDGYVNLLLADVLEKYDYLSPKEKAFIKRVTEGTIERKIQIDYILNQVSNTPTGKMKPLIHELLRMSAYQILFMDTVPDAAVCNEAVSLAKESLVPSRLCQRRAAQSFQEKAGNHLSG